MKNALTIDLEDYYHVSAFRHHVARSEWNFRQSRVERNVNWLLDTLEESGCRATFFTLGWIAEQHPQVVQEVAKRGHEIACHSLCHRTVYEMTREQFREDSQQAKDLLEDCIGAPVKGYRAPSFSITRRSLWALEVLADLGFTYDSSIFPVKHPNYGIADGSRRPHRVETPSGSLVEFPLTTLEFARRRVPLGGGAYFRLLPYWYTRWGIDFVNRKEDCPVCVYLHPWELDPSQPRMAGTRTARLRHYTGLKSTSRKFQKLLRDFQFQPLGELAARF